MRSTQFIETAVFDLEIKKQIVNADPEKCTAEDLDLVSEDLAVHGWKNAHKAGISSGVVLDLERQRGHIFGDTYDEHCELAELLTSSARVVEFNHINFDYPLLAHSTGQDISKVMDMDAPPGVRDHDLLQMAWAGHGARVFGHGFSLDALSASTLGPLGGKNGHGENAPILYQSGLFGPLLNYNLRDVDVTARMADFMWQYGYCLRDGGGKLHRINWKHPQEWFPR